MNTHDIKTAAQKVHDEAQKRYEKNERHPTAQDAVAVGVLADLVMHLSDRLANVETALAQRPTDFMDK